ncbi:MAG: aminotransferase class I/II-fold pyridoxal phosphate-dependent enzyme [Treponema sp.]|nr:aminotransferase class I/II-fold pyridoxal phosphate-dependent enzyme [Treponema sp.]
MLNPLAQELNNVLKNTVADALLSDLGKRMYFPKGIIAQSAEAKKLGKTANATIGMTVVNGSPVILPCIQETAPSFTPRELVAYAPTAGQPELRTTWKDKILLKNPLLERKYISLPVVVPGLTAGISYMADMFIDKDHPLLVADPSWDNYALIVEARRNAELKRFTLFNENGFNLKSFEEAIQKQAKKGTVAVLLNFPQNPSGYSPTHDEALAICEIIKRAADSGTKMLVVCDDAYFGLNYEEAIEKQSLFAYLADISENVLALKIDGPTKEDFAWGYRCGFITFGCKGMTGEQYVALSTKLMGIIRSSVSCSSTPAQTMLQRAFINPAIEHQKAFFRKVLERRYALVRAFVDTHSSKVIRPLPFNSGYFMSLSLNGVNAELLRTTLLNEKGIGTISIDEKTLRIAFSSLDEDKINDVYSAVYETAEKLYSQSH